MNDSESLVHGALEDIGIDNINKEDTLDALGLDSLDQVDLLLSIEDTIGMSLGDGTTLSGETTVADLIKIAETLLAQR